MPQDKVDLDDLRLVRAVASAGSLTGASRRLGIDHSNAFRRLNGLEARLGVRLFERHRDGYALTPAGEAAAAAAGRVEDEVTGLALRLAGADLRPSGTVRVTTTDTLVGLLTPAFATFRACYPEILLEVVVANTFLNLSRRDADVAIRPVASPPEALVGRRVATLATAIYGASRLIPASFDPGPLEEYPWIGFDDSLSHLGAARWLAAHVPPTRVVYRADTLMAVLAAARAGLGLALLPCFLADPEPELARLRPPDPTLETGLWLLTHPDLRRTARVRALLDHLPAALTTSGTA